MFTGSNPRQVQLSSDTASVPEESRRIHVAVLRQMLFVYATGLPRLPHPLHVGVAVDFK